MARRLAVEPAGSAASWDWRGRKVLEWCQVWTKIRMIRAMSGYSPLRNLKRATSDRRWMMEVGG
jgi:hypothetical protein